MSPDDGARPGGAAGMSGTTIRIEPAQIALLWQLAARARDAASEQTLAFTIVNETLALLPYRQAAWWRAPLPGAVGAVSGLPQSDPGAPYVQWLGAVCRVLAREASPAADGARVVRPFGAADLPADAAALAAEWSAWWPAHGLWLTLTDRSGRLLGAVLFARDEAWAPVDLALLSELAQAWSHAFAALHPLPSWTARVRAALKPGRTRRRLLIGAAVLCIVPVRLTVLAPAEVTAKDPFVVRAPLDGVIDRLYVQPNQRVTVGEALLGLDPTTLQSRYAVARKDYDTAQEEYRQTAQLAVTDDKDRLDMALRKGKLDESAIDLDYTAAQLARVRVSATRAGVAVFADTNDWTGRAVAVGEKVMLLADPAHVELTAWLPVADDIDVRPGARLTLYPQSSPLASYDARIETIAYRAEPTPEGVLAYRIKAAFSGDGVRPVLGMMGTARIRGGWVPLVYYVLRRPLATARQWLGW